MSLSLVLEDEGRANRGATALGEHPDDPAAIPLGKRPANLAADHGRGPKVVTRLRVVATGRCDVQGDPCSRAGVPSQHGLPTLDVDDEELLATPVEPCDQPAFGFPADDERDLGRQRPRPLTQDVVKDLDVMRNTARRSSPGRSREQGSKSRKQCDERRTPQFDPIFVVRATRTVTDAVRRRRRMGGGATRPVENSLHREALVEPVDEVGHLLQAIRDHP